jgi:hypothetical protein
MQFKKILMVLVSLAMINFASQAVAQEENDDLAHMVRITAKDGHAKDLEAAITAYHHFMGDKPGAFRYQWFSVMTGPDAGTYIARSGDHNYADFDAVHDWDDASQAKFASDVQPFIADSDIVITRGNDEVGMWPDSLADYSLYSVTKWHVKSGKGRAFDEGLKKVDGILKAGGWPNYYAFYDPISGGKGNTTTLVSPRKNFADLAPKDPDFMAILNKAMGEDEAAAFLAEWSATYYVGQNMLVRHRPDLSDYGDND